MLIRWSEIYANTEILSPIDPQTWQIIGETCKLDGSSRVIELASGKGAFATYLAKRFQCRVDGFDNNPEFVDHANNRTQELRLQSKLKFERADVNRLDIANSTYSLGACLGALYIFRENGWKVLARSVKAGGFLAISDMICRKTPLPRELKEVFFEETNQPQTIEDVRRWYTSRGAEIIREERCSRTAWLNYYNLTRETIVQFSKKHLSDSEIQREVEEGLREDELYRTYGEEYIDYVTFIMKKS